MKGKLYNLFFILVIFLVSEFDVNANTIESNFVNNTFDNNKIVTKKMEQDFVQNAPQEILELYNDGTISITPGWFDKFGRFDKKILVKTEYIETVTEYKNGIAINTIERLISKNDFDNYDKISQLNINSQNRTTNCSVQDGLFNDCWETNAKRLSLVLHYKNGTYDGTDEYKVTVINKWKKIPIVKSYDTIGLLHKGLATESSGNRGITLENAYGYQYYDGNMIYYSFRGDNMKIENNGISISQNIVDSVSKTLSNELWVVGKFPMGWGGFTASYQHAVNDISLATSKNFKFSTEGLGRVFNFSASWNNWDKMQGVCTNIYPQYLWVC